MATSREQLVADWRDRLAAAEEPQPADSQRAAWLARLRIRLYRFLLSLYGEGHWNAPSLTDGPPTPFDSVAVDESAIPLAGKPAKDQSMIRAALESVARAREYPPAQGPLTAGIDRDAWVIVASASQGLDPQLCVDALKEAGISSRLVGRYADVTVDVRLHHQLAAANLIASRPSSLRLRPRPAEPTSLRREQAVVRAERLPSSYLLLALATGPLFGIVGVGVVELFWPALLELPTPTVLLVIFFSSWAGSSGIMCLMYVLFGGRAQTKPTSSSASK